MTPPLARAVADVAAGLAERAAVVALGGRAPGHRPERRIDSRRRGRMHEWMELHPDAVFVGTVALTALFLYLWAPNMLARGIWAVRWSGREFERPAIDFVGRCAIFARARREAGRSMDIGARIATERESRSMTQDALAEATGIERSKIGKIETGDRKVNSTELLLIANVFELPMEALLRSAAPVVMYRRRGSSDPVATQAVIDRFLRYVEDSQQTRELMAAIVHEA